jgi:hypothetical protein
MMMNKMSLIDWEEGSGGEDSDDRVNQCCDSDSEKEEPEHYVEYLFHNLDNARRNEALFF